MRHILIASITAIIAILLFIFVYCNDKNNTDTNTDTYTQLPDNIETDIYDTELDILDNDEPLKQWWTDEELNMLAALIYYEAGSNDCSDRHQQLVGQVVLNRVNSNEFPDTIYDVITQTKHGIQYSTYKKVLKNMGNRDIIPQRCYDNALVVLNGEVDCPDNIVWQAGFIQGSEIYEIHETSYSTTYFCYR